MEAEFNPSEVSLTLQNSSDLAETEINKQPKRSNIPNQNQESCLIFYFKCFFDLGFIVMLVPFRFKLTKSPRTGRDTYQLFSNRSHEIFCIICHTFIVFEFVSVIRLIPSWKELNRERIKILYAGNIIACLIYALVLIYMFWFKRRKFADIFDQLQNKSIFKDPKDPMRFWSAVKVKVFCYGICLMGYAAAMTHPIIHGAFVFPDKIGSFFTRMSMQAKACFLMADLQFVEPDEHDGNIFYTLLTIVFTFIHIIMIIPSTVLVHMLNLFALLTTACCWHTVSRFLIFCKTNDNKAMEMEDWKRVDILDKYSDLKIFMRKINEATGLVFLCCISISLPFYASWTAVLFFEEKIDWFETVHFYVYCTTFLGILTLAAKINKKANEFYDWISTCKCLESIPANKMTTLMMDMYANRIALSGCGIFVLTFRFFVTILSIIVTYTSIIVQFQIGNRESVNPLMRNSSQNEG